METGWSETVANLSIRDLNPLTRRKFLTQSTQTAFGLVCGRFLLGPEIRDSQLSILIESAGYGSLVQDPAGIVDLPAGFFYRIISRAGEAMKDGFYVPDRPDGMAAFEGPDGSIILMRNHELWSGMSAATGAFGRRNQLLKKLDNRLLYDRGRNGTKCLGAVTTLVYNPNSQETVSQHLSLAGTLANCSGGKTPWGTWISCEEEFKSVGREYTKNHGIAFEVIPEVEPVIQIPRPLESMGRFVRESVVVEPRTHIVYQTEDQTDSLFYRFIPERLGQLGGEGRLQCLAVRDRPSFDARNWRKRAVFPGEILQAQWIDLDPNESGLNDLRHTGFRNGAARFASGEGMTFWKGHVIFACTNGGLTGKGQIWRYIPSPNEGTTEEERAPGRLELWVEPNDEKILDHPDQLASTPWGDLFICEDGEGTQHLLGITPQKKIYPFARNVLDESEFTGACFSPDGNLFFVNLQEAGLTLAIEGPWKSSEMSFF